jgi:AraC family transcriptional regulator, ethanolamine operon transcriptional activator
MASTSFSSTRTFSDAHHLAKSLSEFDQDYYQIEQGAFVARLEQYDLDGVHVFSECANRRIVECGGVARGLVTIGWITHAGDDPATFKGWQVGEQTISTVPGGDDWIIHLPRNVRLTGVSVTAEQFRSLTDLPGLSGTRRYASSLTLKTSHQAIAALQAQLHQLQHGAHRLACPEIRAALRSNLLDALSQALEDSTVPERADLTRLTYSDMVRRSQKFIVENPERPLSVLDLCQELRVSRRTLQKSFLQVTGQTPSAFLRSIRLCGVRRLLRHAPAMTIGDAAARWGFFHLGNFAGDYRRMFGELPSQTERQAAGAAVMRPTAA